MRPPGPSHNRLDVNPVGVIMRIGPVELPACSTRILHSAGGYTSLPGICDSGYTIAVLSNLDPPAASWIADFMMARLPAK